MSPDQAKYIVEMIMLNNTVLIIFLRRIID